MSESATRALTPPTAVEKEPVAGRSAAGAAQPRPSLLLTLRQRDFRWFWIGLVNFATALEIQRFMLPWLAYQVTGSAALLGVVGLCVGLPNILFSPVGGVVADRVGRATLIRANQTFAALLAGSLALLLLSGLIQFWHIVLFALFTGTFSAFDQPSRQAIVPKLVPRHVLTNAVALNSSAWSLARITGPAIAGMLLVYFTETGMGPGGVFLVVTAGFLVMVYCAFHIHLPPPEAFQRQRSILLDFTEGIRFVARQPMVRSIMLVVFALNLFGSSYLVLMPVFTSEVLQVDAAVLGILVASFGVGGLLGTTVLALIGGTRRRGLVLLTAAGTFGLLLIAFAFSRSVWLSVPLLVGVGVANAWTATSANTLLQLSIPDGIRGRVMGIYSLSHNFVSMGGALGGLLAARWGAPTAIIVGGLLVGATALLIALREPELRHAD